MRLRSLLALVFALVALAVALCGSLAAKHLTNRRLEAGIGAEMAYHAGQVRNLLDRSMYSRWRDLNILATIASTTATSPGARRVWLDAMQRTFPAYAWIGFADADGVVTAATQRTLEGKNVRARPWFQGGLAAPFAGDLHEAALLAKELPAAPDGAPWRFVDFSAPVRDAAGHLEGVVGAHLSWDWAHTLTQSVLDPMVARNPGTDVLVLDTAGTIILGSPNLQGTSIPASSAVWRAAAQRDSYALETWPDGTTYLIGASRTTGLQDYPGLGWTILIRQDAKAAFSPALKLGRELLVYGVFLAGVAALLGWITAWCICRPLLKLANAADAIGTSGLAQLPKIQGAEELRRLSSALDGMLLGIAARDRVLATTNQNLERRVEQRTRALEAASKAKSRFLAGITHELRTPLNGILGYAQLLRLEGGLTAKQDARLDAMLGAGHHLLEMINSVLDLSSVEAERLELKPTRLELAETARDCLELLRPAADSKDLLLTLTIEPDTPRCVVADVTRLRQILLNLLGNAVKFTPSGSVWLRLAPYGHAGNEIRIAVVDTGPGIPPERRASLFQEFERLGAECSVVEGAGLGLALSARLAGLMGGSIGYEPAPGHGSVFWLQLPTGSELESGAEAPASGTTKPNQAARPPDAGAVAANTNSLRVLVVDDMPMNLDITAAFLRSAGHMPTCVASGESAVEAAGANVFDAILMDVRMAGMDGLTASRHIRNLPAPYGQVPMIALTAQVFAEQIAECRAAGMDSHLPKPFTPEALVAELNRTVTAGHNPAVSATLSPTPL